MTLIVALVMLVIIGLTSAAVMRGALSSDTVANNLRVQTLAQQAAQVGLSYCEQQLRLPEKDRTITVHAGSAPALWTVFGNWFGEDAVAAEVPESMMKSDASSFTPAFLPQCMVEQDNAEPLIYVVTARGFSPDYEQDGSGRAKAGSVIWLQSFVTK